MSCLESQPCGDVEQKLLKENRVLWASVSVQASETTDCCSFFFFVILYRSLKEKTQLLSIALTPSSPPFSLFPLGGQGQEPGQQQPVKD